MTLEAILKAQGLSEEQIKAIMDGMKQNKIFTASEGDLDSRYSKLKVDHDGVTGQLKEANKLIEQDIPIPGNIIDRYIKRVSETDNDEAEELPFNWHLHGKGGRVFWPP